MWHTLEQICAGAKYVDIRSASALARRKLAVYQPGRDENGYSTYKPTEKGMAMNAERQISKVVAGNAILRQIVALFGGKGQ
jgi:hypothetical protein